MAAYLDKATRREYERRAWDMRIVGRKTLDAIAAELGLNRSSVVRMLARVEDRLARQFAARAHAFKARHTAQLERIADEALDAWERSKRDAETIKTVSSDRFGDTTETTLAGQCGDPRMLDQARGAMADIRRIWGADKPPEVKGEGRTLAQIADEAEQARATYTADARPQ